MIGSDVEEVNEEEDDEMERWEKEQIRKGVLISQVGKHHDLTKTNKKNCF